MASADRINALASRIEKPGCIIVSLNRVGLPIANLIEI